ncbi:hypothetical protein ABPG77_005311 [Micractinium sp. CCAP 211/92]
MSAASCAGVARPFTGCPAQFRRSNSLNAPAGRVVKARAAEEEVFAASSTSFTVEAVQQAQPIAEIAAAQSCCAPQADTAAAAGLPGIPPAGVTALLVSGALLAGYGVKKVFDTPSRAYDQNVGQEYDAWTEEGVLEYYWGEHIHLGYYTEEERQKGYKKKNFIQAKYDFVEEMYKWSGASSPATILDVGCGIGGTSRYLAAKFPQAQVQGITLSPNQVKRGTELAAERGLSNVKFQVMDALKMEFPDNSFDLVWACESGEHMPDKKAYVDEMVRVLKPGGTLVIATWCQREETPDTPFSESDKERLRFLYEEWAHPYFVSKEEYGRIMEGTGHLSNVELADWTAPTIDSWRHSIWVGVWDPWIVVFKGPRIWYKTLREIVTLERMHRAFDDGLMEYGMMKATKKAA